MKRVAVIAFTEDGSAVAKRLLGAFHAADCGARGYLPLSHAREGFSSFSDLRALTGGLWSEMQGIVFVGACGIAVRAIAPHVKSKLSDPAVVVLDDGGKYAISLLSGHIGNANGLAEQAAKIVGATSVITTATDVHGVFAVDTWAMENGLCIENPEAIKEVSVRLLHGEPVGLKSEYPVEGMLPSGVTDGPAACGIYIGAGKSPFSITLRLRPRNLLLGVGCRKGTPKEALLMAVEQAVSRHGLLPACIAGIASITLKKGEPGLLALGEELGVPVVFFSAEELAAAEGAFTPSAYVESVTGVDNVCERSAALLAARYGGGGRIISKTAGDGVTVAAYEAAHKVSFYEE